VRRLIRYIVNTLTVVSLVLCLGAAGLWVRSHYVADFVIGVHADRDDRSDHQRYVTLRSDPGRAFLGVLDMRQSNEYLERHESAPPGASPFRWFRNPPQPLRPSTTGPNFIERRFLGFSYGRIPPRGDGYDRSGRTFYSGGFRIITPYWMIVLLTGLLPVIALARWVRKRSPRDANLCPSCGYDLRATPDRCPECGTVASKA
jgi:hypothetical protein